MRYFYLMGTVLIAVACAVFAVSNRGPVTVDLWPFTGGLDLPLYALSLGTAAGGLLMGLLIGWLTALPARLARRRLAQRLATTEADLKRVKNQLIAPPALPTKADA